MNGRTEEPSAREDQVHVDTTEQLLSEEGHEATGASDHVLSEFDAADGVPHDRGWAWMVLLGSFINNALISAYVKTGGVLFVELLGHFGAPASHTALLFAIRGGVLSVGGMFVMNAIIGRIGCRRTALIGALMMSLSGILSSQANEFILLICLQSVFLGISDPMVGSSGEVLTAVYFKRRRPIALGIVKAGVGLSSVCYPPLLTYLVEKYGLRGALLLNGGIALHAFPASLLLRPATYYRKRFGARQTMMLRKNGWEQTPALQEYDDVSEQSSEERVSKTEVETTTKERIGINCKHGDSLLKEGDNDTHHMVEQFIPDEVTNDTNPHVTTHDHDNNANEGHTVYPKPNNDSVPRSIMEQSQTFNQTKPWLQCLKCQLNILDFSLFRRTSFWLIFVYFMFCPNVNVGMDYLPALAQQCGISKTQTAQLLSIVGAMDLASRFVLGFVVNLRVVPVPVIAGTALVGLGLTYQCTRFLTSFTLLMTLSVIQGMLSGVINGIIPLIALHVVGLENMAKAIGFFYLAEGGFVAIFHPFLGYIRDTTGSYIAVYHVIGCILLGAAVVLLCEELLRSREDRKWSQDTEYVVKSNQDHGKIGDRTESPF